MKIVLSILCLSSFVVILLLSTSKTEKSDALSKKKNITKESVVSTQKNQELDRYSDSREETTMGKIAESYDKKLHKHNFSQNLIDI